MDEDRDTVLIGRFGSPRAQSRPMIRHHLDVKTDPPASAASDERLVIRDPLQSVRTGFGTELRLVQQNDRTVNTV